MKYAFGTSQYFKSTPKKIKLAGKGLLLVSGVAAIFVPGAKWVIAVGLIGDFLASNFGEKN